MSKAHTPRSVPYREMLGVQTEHHGAGRTVLSLEPRRELTNSWGGMHGGVVMALLDMSMAGAARSTSEDDSGGITIDMSISFLRAGSGRLVAEGRVLRNGKQLIFCEGDVRDASGELIARALGTYMLRRRDAAIGELRTKGK
jgi:uncharacterized protein (TIGR00369 family)